MNNNIQIYTFQSDEVAHALRVVLRDGEPWFVAADICRALDILNPSDALSRLDDDESTLVSNEGQPGNGPQSFRVVNQSGLYSLVLGSRKPEAKPFKRWITHEVLPSIARTGVYVDANNRMGETLGAATDDVIGIEAKSTATLAGGFVAAMVDALGAFNERLDRSDEAAAVREEKFMDAVDRLNRDSIQQLRSMRQELSRTVGRIVRVNKAQRASNKNLDPNRPLSEDDVERFKYLLGTGATAKQIARSLNRTYEVIRRFMDTNQDLVIRTLQHSLL